jgi:hypothetical protein
MDSPNAADEGKRRYFTPQQRVVVAIAHVLHEKKPCPLSEALEALWDKGWGVVPPSAEKHCNKWRKRLFETAGVEDAAGRGRHATLPDEEAREASELVKAGYEVTPMRGKERLPARRIYFHSIEEAVRRVPRLQHIMSEHDISTEHLLRRMHAVDPRLHWGRMDVKVLLSKERMAERLVYAQRLQALIAQDPAYLDMVIWIDEVKIWFFGGRSTDVHVWCDAHDQGVHMVVPGCGKLGGAPLCVGLYAAVNAVLGLVAVQYSPSTTGFPEDWPQKVYGRLKDAKDRKDADYEVGWVGWNIMLPVLSWVVLVVMPLVISAARTSCMKAKGSRSAAVYAFCKGSNPGVRISTGMVGAAVRRARARRTASAAARVLRSQSRTRTNPTPAAHAAPIILASIVRCWRAGLTRFSSAKCRGPSTCTASPAAGCQKSSCPCQKCSFA